MSSGSVAPASTTQFLISDVPRVSRSTGRFASASASLAASAVSVMSSISSSRMTWLSPPEAITATRASLSHDSMARPSAWPTS